MTLSGLKKKFRIVILNSHHLFGTKIRVCKCCQRVSIIVSLSKGEEYKICIRCRANFRYELLAEVIRENFSDLAQLNVLELDRHSPLRLLFLDKCKTYLRTYFSQKVERGHILEKGIQCEDITKLTLKDNSFDLIVSSDVLEHVPNLAEAFKESCRVLKLGGAHIFTVPTRAITRRRANLNEDTNQITYLDTPEYHSDPLDSKGILAFWDLGFDLGEYFSIPNLKITMAHSPRGLDQRVVWVAKKI